MIAPRWAFRGFQVLTIVSLYAIWLYTQDLLERAKGLVPTVVDHTHNALAAANVYLNANPTVTNLILIVSSLELDIAALSLTAFFFIRRESRPLLSLSLILIMRQLCQASISMPKPDGMIWHHPGFPSLVVTYDAANDFFFSGHMALATLLAAELTFQGAARWKQVFAWGVIGAQALVILTMRFHYVSDVVAGFLAAIVATLFAGAIGSRVDRRVGRWLGPGSGDGSSLPQHATRATSGGKTEAALPDVPG